MTAIDQETDLSEKKKGLNLIQVGILFAIAGIMGVFIYSALSEFKLFNNAAPKAQTETIAVSSKEFFIPEPVEPELPKPEPPPKKEETAPPPPPVVIAPPVAPAPGAPEEPKEPTLAEKRYASKLASNYKSSNIVDFEPEIEYEKSIAVTKIGNPSYTLLQGSKIPCTLETKIVSDFAGQISCIVNEDIYSLDARILLVEKGTKVIGDYEGGEVTAGQTRVAAVWYRMVTPEHLDIMLESESTDNLGGVGIPAHVNRRWMERIGAALVVSLIDDLFEYAAIREENRNDDSGNNNNFVYSDSETQETTQDMAEMILDETINIRPTLTVMQGTTINITVKKDIDFSEVYYVKR